MPESNIGYKLANTQHHKKMWIKWMRMPNEVDRYNFADIQTMDLLTFSGEPF